jgi:hypothetical protein
VGLNLKGGRNDRFFFCLVEYFSEENRWFLKSLLQVKDEEGLSGDEAIRSWTLKYDVTQMVVDTPLTVPACSTCTLDCPGMKKCPEESVRDIFLRIDNILEEDRRIREHHPKTYEKDRNCDDLFDYSRDILHQKADSYLLSRSFKRRLRKGYLPYWNRPVDFWIWCHYYNQMLELFNHSYDSLGHTSLMVQSRFSYLKRHFPAQMTLFESHLYVILIELIRGEVVTKRELALMRDLEEGMDARANIIKKIEARLNIFIYDHDLDLLITYPRAFESFLLAIAGQNSLLGLSVQLPKWVGLERFIVPRFTVPS